MGMETQVETKPTKMQNIIFHCLSLKINFFMNILNKPNHFNGVLPFYRPRSRCRRSWFKFACSSQKNHCDTYWQSFSWKIVVYQLVICIFRDILKLFFNTLSALVLGTSRNMFSAQVWPLKHRDLPLLRADASVNHSL